MSSGYMPPNMWWEYVSFTDGTNPYKETDSDTFVVAAAIINPGTIEGVTDQIKAIISSDAETQDAEVEIYDVTNSVQVAIATASPAPDSPSILDLTPISNLSEQESVWEIRFRRSSGIGFVRIHSMSIRRLS